MKKHITAAIVIAILTGVCNMGCDEDNKDTSVTASMRIVSFDGVQDRCNLGGIKIEVSLNGEVDEEQSQYLCNVVQDKTDFTFRATDLEMNKIEGGCYNGGVKIEVLTHLEVDDALTQYLCYNAISGTQNSTENIDFVVKAFNCEEGSCANGGFKVEIRVDDVVQKEQTKYFCNAVAECATDNVCKKLGESCTQSDQCLGGICYNGTCTGKGDVIIFGNYEQDNDTTNGKEPITWLVLDVNKNHQALLVSKKILDSKPYNLKQQSNSSDPSTTWEECTIRSWLNGYEASYNKVGNDYTSDNFIDTAFAAEEKANIVASYVPAHSNPNYSTATGNATTDKVFMLSSVEAENYFANNEARQAEATPYASNIVCTSEHCYSEWWLRSPGSTSDKAEYVLKSGIIDNRGGDINDVSKLNGVRPALWIQY